jgi:hypothetical protein
MTCPTCGQAAQGTERFCANCGADLNAPASGAVAPTAAAPALAPEATSQPSAPAGELRGVGGWLLLFCVWIVIVDPLLELRVLPYLRYISLNWTLPLSFAVVIYGMVTGIQLWRVRPGALVLLRVYFALVLALTLLTVGLMFYGTYLMHVSLWSVFAWVRTAAFLGIWVTYFRVSQRVRATYGRNL